LSSSYVKSLAPSRSHYPRKKRLKHSFITTSPTLYHTQLGCRFNVWLRKKVENLVLAPKPGLSFSTFFQEVILQDELAYQPLQVLYPVLESCYLGFYTELTMAWFCLNKE